MKLQDWLADSSFHNIVKFPAEVLSTPAKELESIEHLPEVCKIMFRLMYAHNGIGLAAPQVGLPYRFFIINTTASSERADRELVFVNTKVLSLSPRTCVHEEGCLSLPGVKMDIERPRRIIIESEIYKTGPWSGRKQKIQYDGLMSRVVQHEHDHTDGIMFLDRAAKK